MPKLSYEDYRNIFNDTMESIGELRERHGIKVRYENDRAVIEKGPDGNAAGDFEAFGIELKRRLESLELEVEKTKTKAQATAQAEREFLASLSIAARDKLISNPNYTPPPATDSRPKLTPEERAIKTYTDMGMSLEDARDMAKKLVEAKNRKKANANR